MVYGSKKDPWLMAVLGVSLVVMLLATVAVAAIDPVTVVPLLLSTGLAVGLLVPLRYETSEKALDIQSGFIRWHIPLADILEVYPSRSILSSPALSLDRLHVRYRKGDGEAAILISPKEKQAFLEELSRLDPALQLEGDRLRRATVAR